MMQNKCEIKIKKRNVMKKSEIFILYGEREENGVCYEEDKEHTLTVTFVLCFLSRHFASPKRLCLVQVFFHCSIVNMCLAFWNRGCGCPCSRLISSNG